MNASPPSFFARIPLAFGTFFRLLADRDFAARVRQLRAPAGQPATPPKAPPADAALQLLGLLQREARFIDFVEEDVAAYADADLGAAARLVHEGCRKALREHFTLRPVRDEAEGSQVTLDDGFDATAVRITGRVVGQPPFRGSITHRGWRVTEIRLPKLSGSHDATLLAPAEVEL